ncbi:MAG: endonuclease/exonuclease/phosphatase family protein [Pseudomonadota bacterium]
MTATTLQAETFRIATYAAPLSRDGPGLLLRDLKRADDPQADAIVGVIDDVAPDVLILTDFDYDLDGLALAQFARLLADDLPVHFSLMPNAGVPSGFDLDGNGWLGDARDAYGYGRFAGDGGIAILSRYPVVHDHVKDFTSMLWTDLPGARLPQTPEGPFPSTDAQAAMRLSSSAHWLVPLALPDGSSVALMTFAATPPVFDGPEDANGLRNRDELRLWQAVLDGIFGPVPDSFVIAGNANLDPLAGAGYRDAMVAFLADPRLQDPLSGQPTADWNREEIGRLRVSYVLPSTDWTVVDAGVYWPANGTSLGADGADAGPHRLVWVDIRR